MLYIANRPVTDFKKVNGFHSFTSWALILAFLWFGLVIYTSVFIQHCILPHSYLVKNEPVARLKSVKMN